MYVRGPEDNPEVMKHVAQSLILRIPVPLYIIIIYGASAHDLPT